MKVRKPNGRKDGHAGKPKVQARSDDPAAVKLARVESMQANERPPRRFDSGRRFEVRRKSERAIRKGRMSQRPI